MTKKPTLINSIRAKLISAVAMLLVAVIMVVSSTYAWFTLSTAPEVTGITTAIGANGSLEMALMPSTGSLDDITTGVGGSMGFPAANTTWGNLVDLGVQTTDQGSMDPYGLSQIILYPSVLNIDEATGKLKADTGAFLKVPVYGADGRVSELSDGTMTGTWNQTKFLADTLKGVRAVGTSSGMTARQLTFRNARSAATTAQSLAQTLASGSLSTNGSALATIAVNKAMGTDKYTLTDINALNAIVNALLGEEGKPGALTYVGEAYKQYILAYAASSLAQSTITDDQVVALEKTLASTELDALTTAYGSVLPESLTNGITAYKTALATVKEAQAELKALEDYITAYAAYSSTTKEEVTVTWAADTQDEDTSDTYNLTHPGFTAPLNKLANMNKITVNNFTVDEVKDNISAIVGAVTSGEGVKVTMGTGGGVYADIADQCGDYSAAVNIENLEYSGVTADLAATMNTQSTVIPPYLDVLNTATNGLAPSDASSSGNNESPLTEFYGYVIDMAFRTNAANSNLLLQTTPKDRIYGDNTLEETMGHGSTMSFQSVNNTNFSEDQVRQLMKSLRVVFFDPSTGDIFGYARLDMTTSTTAADGTVTASLYLYTEETTTTTILDPNFVDTNGNVLNKDDTSAVVYYYNATGDTYHTSQDFSDAAVEMSAVLVNTAVATKTETSQSGKLLNGENDSKAITTLQQNSAQAVSMLVYLDGTEIGNDDVAAVGGMSMKGQMNIQFGSDAQLTPMDYTDLHQPATSYNVTLPDAGVTGERTVAPKTEYEFTVETGYALGSITVGGDPVTPTAGENGKYTIPADKVTGDIVINVTATS